MKSWLAAGAVAVALIGAAPQGNAQSNVIGNGLLGAGVGAAIGGIAGGGRGAATGALVGGTVGAVGTAVGEARPRYYGPRYRYYAAHRGCRWIPAHRTSWGAWRPGHCAY